LVAPEKKILIIDDEPSITSLLCKSFATDGYLVEFSNTGVEGIIQARRFHPNLILIDIMLPDLSGYEVIKILREEIDIPLILFSSKSKEEEKIHGFKVGADDYIVKPFSLKELKVRVDAHMRRINRVSNKYETSTENVISYEKININLLEHKIFYDSEEIKLTNREFEIIKLLCRNPGRVFSREEIYSGILGSNSPYFENHMVTEHIKKIRKKLKYFNCSSYIQTVWGVGYRWGGN